MDEKRRKLLLFGGAILIGVIFITSYLAFSNNNNTGTTTTTTLPHAQTYVVSGTANGVIVNYTDVAYLRAGSGANAVSINNTLNSLEASGAISNYVSTNSTYEVLLGSINPYQFYKSLNETTNISVSAGAYVRLPAYVTLYYGASGEIPVTIPRYNYTVTLNNTLPINSTVPLRITALVTSNGSIYNNQLELGVAHG